jgi:hypothetical protein
MAARRRTMPLTDGELCDLANLANNQPAEIAQFRELDRRTRMLARICLRLDAELRAAMGQPPSPYGLRT